MEFITMSFAEIIALQNIVNKDEEEEPKKVSKKTRKNHSFNKGERTQMEEKALKKKGNKFGFSAPAEGASKEEKRLYHNAVRKASHYDTNRAYEAISRKEREAKANKYGFKIEKGNDEPWTHEIYSYEEVYLIPYHFLEAKEGLAAAKAALEEKKEELKKIQFFLNSFEGEAAGEMTVAECYHLYDHTASEEQRLLYYIDIYEDDVRYAEAEYEEAKAAYDMLPFWVR